MIDRAAPIATLNSAGTVPMPGARSRRVYAVLAWVFVAGIVVQVFLAGLAIFDSPAYWAWHVRFIQALEAVPLAMVILSFTGRMTRQQRLLTAIAFLLVTVQHGALALGQALDLPFVSAIHTANALAIFGLAVWLTITSRAAPAD